MSKIAVIGAGKTGRGFIGRLLAQSEQEMVFIDKDQALVDALNAAGEFHVSFFGNVRKEYAVSNYHAYTWEDADLTDVRLILVSVGGQNLMDVGHSLSEKLAEDVHYYIITAENASHPSKTLREAIGKDNISVSESTVFCTTIERDGLDINSENYPYLQCDADLLDGYVPDVKDIRPIGEFSDFLTRKLYTYNAASCVIAYLGWIMGYENYGDAANDERILEALDTNYAETNCVLCQEFGYEKADQEEFAALSKTKFCDRTIVDTVARNARDPKRKLAAGERIMGPLRLILQYGGDATVLKKTCAAAVLYDADQTGCQDYDEVLTGVCGIDKEEPLYQEIVSYMKELRERQ